MDRLNWEGEMERRERWVQRGTGKKGRPKFSSLSSLTPPLFYPHNIFSFFPKGVKGNVYTREMCNIFYTQTLEERRYDEADMDKTKKERRKHKSLTNSQEEERRREKIMRGEKKSLRLLLLTQLFSLHSYDHHHHHQTGQGRERLRHVLYTRKRYPHSVDDGKR